MKLRQKLALVLATAMVVTAVPVVTFAATSNRVTNVAAVTKNTVFTKEEAPELVLKLEDAVTTESTFYITIENAEFVKTADEKGYTVDGDLKVGNETVTVKATSKTELQVTLPGTLEKNDEIRIPMATKVKEGEAKATIEGTKAVTGQTLVFANTQTGSVSVKIGELKSFYTDGGKLADIELTENVVKAFAGEAKDVTVDGKKLTDVVEVAVELDSSDYEIVKNKLVVKTGRGFGEKDITADVNAIFEDDQVTIYLPKAAVTGTEKGRVTISGIEVDTDKKSPSTGDLNVTISSDVVEDKEYKVATIAEYGSKITVKDDKVVDITAGRDEKVTFTLKQVVTDSIVANRTIDFAIENGFIFGTEADLKAKLPEGLELKSVEFDDDDVKTKLITEFTVTVDTVKDKYEFKDVKVVGMLGKEGDITLTAEGRALGQEIKTVIAKVNPSIKVTTESVKLEAGVRTQKGGKITITETDKDMMAKGDIVITLDEEDGFSFTDEPEVKVTSGDIKLGEAKLDKAKGTVTIPVTRTSKEASTIEISNFPVKISRSVPDGEYKVELSGTALANEYKTVDKDDKEVVKNYGKQKVEDFFVIGEGATTKIVTSIGNGATEMVVNGEKVTLPSAAYINNGKLMAPLRAVANAFGFENNAINYDATTKEILVRGNGTVVKLAIGSKQAYSNGTPITLAVPAEIKAESTYVPVGDLGRLLGLDVKWDAATKTATFSN